MLCEINSQIYNSLKTEIEEYKRLCGYYIVGVVSIRHLRKAQASQEAILERVIDFFDEKKSETDPKYLVDDAWTDYETSSEEARTHAIEALMGGRPIGHTQQVMTEAIATDLYSRLVDLCGITPRFYTGLGIGDRKYAFTHGVLIVSDNLAGILWIVEDD